MTCSYFLFSKTTQTTCLTGAPGARVPHGDAAEIAVANDPAALAARMNLLLLNGRMSGTLQGRLTSAIQGVAVPANGTPAQVNAALLNRAKLAIFMTMASPEYLVQR